MREQATQALKEADEYAYDAMISLAVIGLWDDYDERRHVNRALASIQRANALLSHGLSAIALAS